MLFLTKEGWEENKHKIRTAFENSLHPRGTWDEFVSHVEEHFLEIEESIKKRVAKLQKDIKALKQYTI